MVARGWIEPHAVVVDAEQELVFSLLEAHLEPVGSRVLQGVVERLLDDSKDLLVDSGPQAGFARHLETDVLPVDSAEHLEMLIDRGGQAVAFDRGRA